MRQHGANNMPLAPIAVQTPAGTSNQTAWWELRLRYRHHHDPRPEWLVASPGHRPSTVLGRPSRPPLPRLPLPLSLILRIGLGRCPCAPSTRREHHPSSLSNPRILDPSQGLPCPCPVFARPPCLGSQLEPCVGPWSAANRPDPTQQGKFPHPDCLGGSPDRALLSAHLDSNRECMPFIVSSPLSVPGHGPASLFVSEDRLSPRRNSGGTSQEARATRDSVHGRPAASPVTHTKHTSSQHPKLPPGRTPCRVVAARLAARPTAVALLICRRFKPPRK